MTIRDYLRRRVALIKPVSTAGTLALLVLGFRLRGERYHPAPGDAWVYAAMLAVVGTVLVVLLWGQARLRCPRCGQNLSKLALLFAYAPDKVTACPHCGVSFDEETRSA
jgi:uncharacterized membrane-anchored protein